MKRRIKYLVIVLSVICLTFKLNAQDTKVIGDLEQWTSIGISKKINKHWKISLDEEFRFTKDLSRFDTYFTDLGLDYSFNKHFSIGANYRFYQNKNNDGVFQTLHRWNADFQYKEKINRFTLAYRLRFQDKDEDFFTSKSGDNLYNLRNKLSVNYNIKNFKFDPFFDAELYRQIENVNSSELSKLRLTLGLKYSLKEFGSLETFYQFDKELNTNYPKNTYIIGVGYKFSF